MSVEEQATEKGDANGLNDGLDKFSVMDDDKM